MSVHSASAPRPAGQAPSRPGWGSLVFIAVCIIGVVLIVSSR